MGIGIMGIDHFKVCLQWYGLSSQDGPGEEGWACWEMGSEPIWASNTGILCTWPMF